jgi:hypothetical protein
MKHITGQWPANWHQHRSIADIRHPEFVRDLEQAYEDIWQSADAHS